MSPLEPIRIKYKIFPIICATILFFVCSLWLVIGPRTSGMVGRILDNEERISIIGATAIAFSIALTLLFLFHFVRAVMGLPAIESDNHSLRIYVFPFKKIDISEISSIDAGDKWLVITKKNGKIKKVNLAILDGWESKIDLIKGSVR